MKTIRGEVGKYKIIFCDESNKFEFEDRSDLMELGIGYVKGRRKYFLYTQKNDKVIPRSDKFRISQWVSDVIAARAKECTGFDFTM